MVVDTNVLVSGIYNLLEGPTGTILRLVTNRQIAVCVDARILFEYRYVCGRPKFRFDPELVSSVLAFVESSAIMVVPRALKTGVRDRKDLPFLETAVTARAAFLITGNRRHFPDTIGPARVVSPADFVEWYATNQT